MHQPVLSLLCGLAVVLASLSHSWRDARGQGTVRAAALPARPVASALAAPQRLARNPGRRGSLDPPVHACQDLWETLNPLADCYVDPSHPLRDALAAEITRSLHDFAVGIIDDIATGLDTVLTWGGQDDPANPAAPGLLARTPAQDSYAHPVVARYWALCRLVANGALALLILLLGFEVLWSTRVGRSYEGALEVLRPLLLAALLANVSLPLLGLVIELGNSLCAVVGGMPGLLAGVTTPSADETVAHALFRLLYLIMAVLVLVQLVMRLAFLDLLLILSPLGLLCYAWPRSRRWGETWARLFGATAAQQVLQLLALHVSSDLLAHLPGLAGPADAVVDLLLGSAGLLLVVRLPRLLAGVHGLGPLPSLASALGSAGAGQPAARSAPGARAAGAAIRSGGGRP